MTPRLVWPHDAPWYIATEVDFAYTLVGGSRSAINRVLDSATSEVFKVDAADDMSWDGVTLNEACEPALDPGNPFP